MNILIIGNCGVGKTYIMTELIDYFKCHKTKQVEQLHYSTNETQPDSNKINIVGRYDGSTFQGSDRLSMSVMTSVDSYLNSVQGCNIFEGDRFTNGKFIAKAKPYIIKLLGNGKQGREMRGSEQTERQIKSISTRVSNISADAEVDDSNLLLICLKNILSNNVNEELIKFTSVYKSKQQSLF